MPRPGKRKHTAQVIAFDKDSRVDYLTGFHKRKVQRTKKAQEEAAKRAREEKIRDRKELRDGRKEELQKHVEAVTAALNPIGATDEETDDDSDYSVNNHVSGDEAVHKQDDTHRQDEYVDEERFTTVTIEPINLEESSEGENEDPEASKHREGGEDDKKKSTKNHPKKEKKKKFTYLTKAERRETTRKIKATKMRRATEGREARKAKGGTTKGIKGKGKLKKK